MFTPADYLDALLTHWSENPTPRDECRYPGPPIEMLANSCSHAGKKADPAAHLREHHFTQAGVLELISIIHRSVYELIPVTLPDGTLCSLPEVLMDGDAGEALITFEILDPNESAPVYYQAAGYYSSYDGADFSESALFEVEPVPVVTYHWREVK